MQTAMISQDWNREDDFQVAKHRLDSFRMGGERPASGALKPTAAHRRSHSRSTSSVSSMSAFSFPPVQKPTSDMPAPTSRPVSKRNSHHRRQSSVSTRHESAEVMGLSLPDLPAASSNDNINLGDKDSIRRRALMALEGKSELGSFTKMEIPELVSPKIEQTAFSFPSKPSFPPGIGGVSGLAINMGKRDSFGKNFTPSSSLKDQLHTLIEEEEEEEEADTSMSSESSEASATAAVTSPVVSGRPRPAALNIQSATCTTPSDAGLPTPSLTPSPRSSGLRPLTLTSSPTPYDGVKTITNVTKRQSWTTPPSSDFTRWPSPNCDSPGLDRSTRLKRTSISYMSGDASSHPANMLPTPETTPTSLTRRMSLQSQSSESSRSSDGSPSLGRPLSVSEQHFLFKSHNAMLARIEDLERSLRSQSRGSRRSSTLSESSSSGLSEPSEEMLSFITDLKAERDELKADVEGWRTRVADYEKQVVALARRLETECVAVADARARTSALEAEKMAAEKALAKDRADRADLQDKLDAARRQRAELDSQLIAQADEKALLESEVAALRTQLADERRRRESSERELDAAGLLATPTAAFGVHVGAPLQNIPQLRSHGLGFQSIDSQATDVESLDGNFSSFKLKAVVEEDEDQEENDLLHYEDEEEDDIVYGSPSSSTTSLDDETAQPAGDITDSSFEDEEDTIRTPRTPSPMTFAPKHAPNHSLSRAWTFPRGAPAPQPKPVAVVDRFFACLEDDDSTRDPLERTEEAGKNLFCQLAASEDDDVPFFLPSHVGVEVEEERVLDIVLEEEEVQPFEDDFVGEEVDGGIRFVFDAPSPPLSPVQAPAPVTKPMFMQGFADEEEESFTFPQSRDASTPVKVAPPSLVSSSSASPSPKVAKPSGIPQPRSFVLPRMPPAVVPHNKNVPTNIPTFIPQPMRKTSGGTPPRSVGEFKFPPRAATTSTPPLPSSSFRPTPNAISPRHDDPRAPHPATEALSSPSGRPFAVPHTPPPPAPSASSMISPRRAFETFTNLIPAAFSWTTRAAPEPTPASPPPPAAPAGLALRGVVSREQQLEKLRRRMEEEQRSKSAGVVESLRRA